MLGKMLTLGALLAASLLAPAAAADQSIQEGPLTVTTYNAGDGTCGSPGTQRYAIVEAAPDSVNRARVSLGNGCSAYGFEDERGTWRWSNEWLLVSADRCTFEGCATLVGAGWYFLEETTPDYGYRTCWSNLVALGVVANLGCPSLEGDGPPVLPALP